jgi:hypothetical protein
MVKRPEREVDQSLPSSAEIKNWWSIASTAHMRLHGVVFRNMETLPLFFLKN